jgi:membrane associated rhomboid family serine protease
MSVFNKKSIFLSVSKSDVIKIAVITSLTFVILHFIRITLLMGEEDTTFFYTMLWNKVCLPPTLQELLYQPWSLITYMFTDMSFTRILGNMIWLWIFGMVIEDLKGNYRILPIYLIGGMFGGFLMVVFNTYSTHPFTTFYAGGMASLLAVAVASLLYKPTYKFWFFGSLSVPIWLLVLIFIALNSITINTHTWPFLFLMLGGIITGVLYNYGLTSFFEWCTIQFKRFGNFFNNNENFVLKKENKLRVYTNENIPYRTIHADSKRIDDILDKINEKGMNSLAENEKKILNEYSKK